MQVAKAVTVKVSKRINRDKFLAIRKFVNTYQNIARLYYSHVVENGLVDKLISGKMTAMDIKNILHQQLYQQIKESFDIGSQTIQEVRDVIVEAFNSHAELMKDFLDGKIKDRPSLPKVRNFTVRMNHNRVASIFTSNAFPFFFKVKLNGGKRIPIPIACGEMQKGLLNDALNGKYKIGAIQLVIRNGWYYFVVPIKKDIKIKKSENVVSADLGLRNSAVISVLHEDGKISDVEFVKYHHLLDKVRHLWNRIDELKSMLPEGQRTSKRIHRYWRKIARVNNWIAHNISRKLVNIAVENDCMVALEDLRRLRPSKGRMSRKTNRKLANWIHGKVAKFTRYKANWDGIFAKMVYPRGTSHRCHICGSQGLRHGSSFKCPNGHIYDADFNASINIGSRAKFPTIWGIVNTPMASSHKAPCES